MRDSARLQTDERLRVLGNSLGACQEDASLHYALVFGDLVQEFYCGDVKEQGRKCSKPALPGQLREKG
jgi:hypothetical protein